MRAVEEFSDIWVWQFQIATNLFYYPIKFVWIKWKNSIESNKSFFPCIIVNVKILINPCVWIGYVIYLGKSIQSQTWYTHKNRTRKQPRDVAATCNLQIKPGRRFQSFITRHSYSYYVIFVHSFGDNRCRT